MNNRININDPKSWSDLSWDDPVVPTALQKSDATVNRSRSAFFKKGDPTFSKTMSEAAIERNQNPDYIDNLHAGIANRDNTYQAESNARPEVKAKISKKLKGVPKSEQAKKKYKEVKTNKYGDANYEAAHKAGLAKRDDPFHAGKYGIFPSMAEAARQVEEKGILKNAYKKFSKWKTENPKEYYFIKEDK